MAPSVHAALSARDWPGNVRELRNIADRLVLGVLDPADIADVSSAVAGLNGASLSAQVSAFERAVIARTLSENEGRVKPTYEALGVSRKTLYDKMQRHGIDRTAIADVEDS